MDNETVVDTYSEVNTDMTFFDTMQREIEHNGQSDQKA